MNIYAPNEVVNRRELWEELLGAKTNSTDPWCIGGDFNKIMVVNERVDCRRVDGGMNDFLKFCNNMEMIDIPMLGRKYTWTNYQNYAIHSRLDRLLMA